MHYSYELHRHPDPEFPVIFHLDTVSANSEMGHLHWHEGIELLYCIEGSGVAVSNDERVPMTTGDLVVINTGRLHSIYSEAGCRYYCLITAPELFVGTELPVAEGGLRSLVRDNTACDMMDTVVGELLERRAYYRTAVRGVIVALYTHLYRHYPQVPPTAGEAGQDGRLALVKAVLSHIRHNFSRQVTLETISRDIGFSRDYTCHVFKQLTGQTIIAHLNFVRCANAKSLLLNGGCNIGESARQSGYSNLSYFSKTYRALMGETPSATSGRARGRERQVGPV